jgi:acetylornithine aminotransferase
LGVCFEFDTKKLRQHLLFNEKIFVGSSADPTILRLLPPLTIDSGAVDQLVSGLTKSLKNEELLIH